MERWEIATHKFIEEWKTKDEIIGFLVCGSYVTGNPSDHSDIDIHIILSEETTWREKGNKYIGGYLFEYFANPPKQIREYFKQDYENRRTMSMVQFLTGEIITDEKGVIKRLKDEAQQWLRKSYKRLGKTELEIIKYSIWDTLDNLKDCYEQNKIGLNLTYYNALDELFDKYCKFLRIETIPFYQICSYLTDKKYLEKYLKDPFPDEVFREMFIKAIIENRYENKIKLYEELSNHVLTKMGGFKIDGWKIRSSLDIS